MSGPIVVAGANGNVGNQPDSLVAALDGAEAKPEEWATANAAAFA